MNTSRRKQLPVLSTGDIQDFQKRLEDLTAAKAQIETSRGELREQGNAMIAEKVAEAMRLLRSASQIADTLNLEFSINLPNGSQFDYTSEDGWRSSSYNC